MVERLCFNPDSRGRTITGESIFGVLQLVAPLKDSDLSLNYFSATKGW